MTIFLVSTQPEICHIIAKKFPQHSCFVFSSLPRFTQMLDDLNRMPDLVIMDYLTFNHDIYNVYGEMKRHKVYIPLIFYNDPCLTLPTRSLHWKNQIEYEKPHGAEYTVTEELMEIFKTVEQMVESPELSPYIALMQKPLPLPDSIKNFDDYTKLLDIRTEEKLDYIKQELTAHQYFLFDVLFSKKGSYLSLNEITAKYKENQKSMTEKSLEVIISRLKTKLKSLPNSGFYIQSSDKTYGLFEK